MQSNDGPTPRAPAANTDGSLALVLTGAVADGTNSPAANAAYSGTHFICTCHPLLPTYIHCVFTYRDFVWLKISLLKWHSMTHIARSLTLLFCVVANGEVMAMSDAEILERQMLKELLETEQRQKLKEEQRIRVSVIMLSSC